MWLRWRGQWAPCRRKASTRSGPRWWRWNQRQTAVSRTSGWASSRSSPPSSPPAAPRQLLPGSLSTEQQNILTSKMPTIKYQSLKMCHTPNQEAWFASNCSRGSAMAVSSGMTGELYPSTNPKLMGPRTEAKVARYNFLFFTLLRWEQGTEQVVNGKVQG